MLETEPTGASGAQTPNPKHSDSDSAGPGPEAGAVTAPRPRRRAASRPVGAPSAETAASAETPASAEVPSDATTGTEPAPAPARGGRRARKAAPAGDSTAPVKAGPKSKVQVEVEPSVGAADAMVQDPAAPVPDVETPAPDVAAPADKAPAARTRRRAAARTGAAPAVEPGIEPVSGTAEPAVELAVEPAVVPVSGTAAPGAPVVLFQAPEPEPAPRRRRSRSAEPQDSGLEEPGDSQRADEGAEARQASGEAMDSEGEDEDGGGPRRRRRRGGRGRRRRGAAEPGELTEAGEPGEATDAGGPADTGESAGKPGGPGQSDDLSAGGDVAEGEVSGSRRRRRRRRRGEDGESGNEESTGVATRSRSGRGGSDSDVASVKGSTRLEAKKQRRREGREANRRRPPVLTEAEFLARREAVDRVMLVRQAGARTQIAVIEDGILVEHYVTREQSSSYVGNVYLGKVQNVLPSMEAAFVDIGKGRNAVLYAGEVNWDAAGLDGQPKRIEQALKSGDSVLVQVTKDPMGHKGARLTSQVSMPGRFLVYVPGGSMTGISRKLPDTERSRLKKILRQVLPEDAGVIVRTAAEGASEEELARDVARLTAQWEAIEKKSRGASAPALLHAEPDLTVRVIRDIFNEDFARLVVSGDEAWQTVHGYVEQVAPDMLERVTRWTDSTDIFAEFQVDEQLVKALDRKVWLPSGGYLVIDRTEAMVVIDVNTGKFTGKGGNLEETVTKNNIEAAEEIVRQLRLRDLGGIMVIDFIDMVLESNRDLVLRRLVECLGRDRTRHQVAEVTSLGLVQMTRKRIGQGLLEAFSSTCEACGGRGVKVSLDLGEPRRAGQAARVTPALVSATIAAARSAPAAAPGSETGSGPGSEAAAEPVRRGRRRRATAPAGQPGATEEHGPPMPEPGLV